MDTRTEFFDAIQHGDVERAQSLLAADASLATARNQQGLSAVLVACYHRQREALALLLPLRRDLDIFEAASTGDRDRVEHLLAQDPALVSAWSVDGGTALHLAAFFRHAEIVELLIGGGADVNAVARGFGNVTPLHSAVAGRNTPAVAALLKAGANPNVKQQGGWTPLQATAMHGDIEAARLLLEHGADPAMRADNGQSAADVAREKGHAEVVALLEKHQAAAS